MRMWDPPEDTTVNMLFLDSIYKMQAATWRMICGFGRQMQPPWHPDICGCHPSETAEAVAVSSSQSFGLVVSTRIQLCSTSTPRRLPAALQISVKIIVL